MSAVPTTPGAPGAAGTPGIEAQRTGRVRRFLGRKRPVTVIVAASVLGLLVLAAVTADFVRPMDSRGINLARSLEAPSLAHPMGTDQVGRDLLTLAVHGLRLSFGVSILAAMGAMAVGALIGVAAGTLGGRADGVMMRGIDVFQSQNHFLFAILIVVLFRPTLGGAGAIALSVAVTHWVQVARIVRGELLSLRERPFVQAAVNGGVGRARLATRHFLPHLIPQLGLAFVLMMPHAIFHESGLSFLGLGMPPDQASLGNLLSDSRRSLMLGGWWTAFFPGALIFIASLCVGVVGEYVRERSNPRWRSELEL
ncbi:MAG: ABC transporter permease [Dehalococcoidia bacterium]|nr:ABC transporter permease [Dehalococcoidia bacterium]